MTRTLALFGILLAAVVVAEATFPPGGGGLTALRPAGTRLASPPGSNRAARTDKDIDERVATTLARPLFAPDRKPVAGTMPADPGMPRLTGIIASSDGAAAIFQPEGNARSVVARYGQRVGGWELTAITASAVSLRKDDTLVVLSPRFAGSEQAKMAAAPKSRWEVAAASGWLRARWSNPQLQP